METVVPTERAVGPLLNEIDILLTQVRRRNFYLNKRRAGRSGRAHTGRYESGGNLPP
jgi:hypothetical protein